MCYSKCRAPAGSNVPEATMEMLSHHSFRVPSTQLGDSFPVMPTVDLLDVK